MIKSILADTDNQINNLQKQWFTYYNKRSGALIDILQKNGFSYERIASELRSRGQEVTYQTIYRVHKQWMKEKGGES